jgi:serine/threonine protein kinase|nr:protein kinase [Candidatus Krumholzibacteria bacterium]
MGQVTITHHSIDGFRLEEGNLVADKYLVVETLGKGWEGEVYLVREKSTGIERSLKIYYPRRNPGNRTVRQNARKLHKLRDCPILIQYRTQEKAEIGGQLVTMLVADFAEGESLYSLLGRQPGRRLDFFQGLHLLHSLALGMEKVHHRGEYHGDIHDENIIVRRVGLGFEIRLLDMLDLGPSHPALVRRDVHQMIRVFYDALGGAKHYKNHPPEIKSICCGLKKSLMDSKFRNAGQLRVFLEDLEWVTR